MLKGAEQKLRNIPSTSTEDGTGLRQDGSRSCGGSGDLSSGRGVHCTKLPLQGSEFAFYRLETAGKGTLYHLQRADCI